MRKEAFDAVGGFSESLCTMEDMDFCVKLFYGRPSGGAARNRTSFKQNRSRGSQNTKPKYVAIGEEE